MRLSIRRTGYALGAEVTGVDLSRELDDATVAAIRKAWIEHAVLCFPSQNLDAAELKAFSSRFGELDDFRSSPEHRNTSDNTVRTLSNLPAGGFPYGRQWHSDRQYTERPATATFLVAKDLPDVGGDTMFASMYAAFDSLSPAMQRLTESLTSVFDVSLQPNFKFKTAEQQATQIAINPPMLHPLVRTHPESGRRALFVGECLRNFEGMTVEESQPIRDFLLQHAVRYAFLYVHRWRVDDVVMWDNRCTMHYAVANYDQTQLRRLLRTTLIGPETGRPLRSERTAAAALH